MDIPAKEIALVSSSEIAEGIDRMRHGKITVIPGYDGEFGVVKIFSGKDGKSSQEIYSCYN